MFFKVKERALELKFKKALAEGKIKTNCLVAIKASAVVSTNWENSHELKIAGKCYDVVLKQSTATGLVYYCVHDDDESALYALMDAYQADTDEEDDEDESSSALHFSPLYFQTTKAHYFYVGQTKVKLSAAYSVLNSQNSAVPPSPPPKA